MYGNFSELNRKDSDQTLGVKGWLVWEAGDVKADLTITVTQATTTGSKAVTITRDPNDPTKPDRWEVEVTANGSGPWAEGTAAGLAGASTARQSGGPVASSWNAGPLRVG